MALMGAAVGCIPEGSSNERTERSLPEDTTVNRKAKPVIEEEGPAEDLEITLFLDNYQEMVKTYAAVADENGQLPPNYFDLNENMEICGTELLARQADMSPGQRKRFDDITIQLMKVKMPIPGNKPVFDDDEDFMLEPDSDEGYEAGIGW